MEADEIRRQIKNEQKKLRYLNNPELREKQRIKFRKWYYKNKVENSKRSAEWNRKHRARKNANNAKYERRINNHPDRPHHHVGENKCACGYTGSYRQVGSHAGSMNRK